MCEIFFDLIAVISFVKECLKMNAWTGANCCLCFSRNDKWMRLGCTLLSGLSPVGCSGVIPLDD